MPVAVHRRTLSAIPLWSPGEQRGAVLCGPDLRRAAGGVGPSREAASAPAPGRLPSTRSRYLVRRVRHHARVVARRRGHVLRLTDSVGVASAARTPDDYVVTPALADAFDAAMGLVAESITSGVSRGAF